MIKVKLPSKIKYFNFFKKTKSEIFIKYHKILGKYPSIVLNLGEI